MTAAGGDAGARGGVPRPLRRPPRVLARPGRSDGARHGDRRRRTRRDAGPVEDRRQPDRRAVRRRSLRPTWSSPPSPSGAAATLRDVLPWDAEPRLQRLNGVAEAGTVCRGGPAWRAGAIGADQRPARQHRVPASRPGGITRTLPRGAADAAGRAGSRIAGTPTARTGSPCSVDAADRRLVTRVDQQPAIFVGDRLYQVIGPVDDVERQPVAARLVIIPDGTARREFASWRRARCRSRRRSAPWS